MTLDEAICNAIDEWHKTHPELTVNQIFDAMRLIHKDLSEAAKKYKSINIIQMRDWQR